MLSFTSPADGDLTGSLPSMTGEGNGEIINVGINVRALPEDIQRVCQDLDENGDGVLDIHEFRKMVSTYAVLRKANGEGSVSIAALPDKVQPALKIFDADGDGTVDPNELMRAAEMYQDSKKSQKRLRKMLIGLVLFVVALIGVNAAMTFMMVELGKETKASPDGIMRVNTNHPDHPGAVVRIATNGEASSITSALPDSAFAELKQFEVKSENGAFLSLMVLGWYRIPDAMTARTGSFVKIITYAGFITLDGDQMTFEETTGRVFQEAGFEVVSGRKLLGIYELIGLFNSIDNWDGLDADAGELKPSFGANDFEMKYIERIPCTPDKTCVNPIDDTWHKAAGPAGAAVPEYIELTHEVLYDSDTHATSEATWNAEYPDSIVHKYRSAVREVIEQLDKSTGDASYCFELDGVESEDTAVWNVTEAVKVGESLSEGRMVRHFRIGTGITEAQHTVLTLNAGEEVPYTGSYTVEYYDDKATGHPVKFVMAEREFIVTSYEEVDVEFPEPWDDAWDIDDESCVSGDSWEDLSLPVRVQSNPFLLNLRDRMVAQAEADGIFNSTNPLKLGANANNTNSRRLLSTDDLSVDVESFVDPITGGARRSLLSEECSPYDGSMTSAVGMCKKWNIAPGIPPGSALGWPNPYLGMPQTWGIPIKIGKYEVVISSWKFGCGLSSITVSGQCPYGLTCYGTCSGTTPLLCNSGWGMYCGIGVTMDVNDMVPAKLKDALNRLGVKAELGAEMGYTATTKTLSFRVWGSLATGDLAKKRMAARRLLTSGEDFTALDSYVVNDNELTEGEDQASIADVLSDTNGRKLLYGKKRRKKHRKKMTHHVAKAAQAVTVAIVPKSGVRIEISGTGAMSFAGSDGSTSPRLSLTAAVDGQACVIGVCFTISETILRL